MDLNFLLNQTRYIKLKTWSEWNYSIQQVTLTHENCIASCQKPVVYYQGLDV